MEGHAELAALAEASILSEPILLPLLRWLGEHDVRARGRACCVCRTLNELGSEESLWRYVCELSWPEVPFEDLAALAERRGGYRRMASQPKVLAPEIFVCAAEVAAALPPSNLGLLVEEMDGPNAGRFVGWGLVSQAQIEAAVASPQELGRLASKWTLPGRDEPQLLAGLYSAKPPGPSHETAREGRVP